MKLGTVNYHGHTNKFYLNHILFDEAFKYGDGAKLLRLCWDKFWTSL